MTTERLRRIRDTVTTLTTNCPSTDETGLCWYRVHREDPNYYQLGQMTDDTNPLYNVWANVQAEFDTDGNLHVSATVVLYDIQTEYKEMTYTVFDEEFDGYNQPIEQMFLNNMPAYQEQLQKRVEDAVEIAEGLSRTDSATAVQ